MNEFNLNNWIENVVQSKIDQAVATMQQTWEQKTQDFINTFDQKIKVFEQHSREVRMTFEQNINEKLNQMITMNKEELYLKIEEEVNKKYQSAKKQFLTKEERYADNDFEQHIMMKMDEKIESKSEELSVTFQAQIIKELEQVMAVVQQVLNNGLDLDKNIGQELTEKFEVFLDSNKEELDKMLKEKMKYLLNSNENNLEDKLESKVNAALEKAFNEKSVGLIKEFEEKGTRAFMVILDGKLNDLKSQKKDNKEAQEIEVLKMNLELLQKTFTMQNSKECSITPESDPMKLTLWANLNY